jgi:molybdopterin-binding protein
VTLEPPAAAHVGSARNRLTATVRSVTPLGARVRVALELPQVLVAEITLPAVAALAVAPGAPAVALVKATAVRLLPAA